MKATIARSISTIFLLASLAVPWQGVFATGAVTHNFQVDVTPSEQQRTFPSEHGLTQTITASIASPGTLALGFFICPARQLAEFTVKKGNQDLPLKWEKFGECLRTAGPNLTLEVSPGETIVFELLSPDPKWRNDITWFWTLRPGKVVTTTSGSQPAVKAAAILRPAYRHWLISAQATEVDHGFSAPAGTPLLAIVGSPETPGQLTFGLTLCPGNLNAPPRVLLGEDVAEVEFGWEVFGEERNCVRTTKNLTLDLTASDVIVVSVEQPDPKWRTDVNIFWVFKPSITCDCNPVTPPK